MSEQRDKRRHYRITAKEVVEAQKKRLSMGGSYLDAIIIIVIVLSLPLCLAGFSPSMISFLAAGTSIMILLSVVTERARQGWLRQEGVIPPKRLVSLSLIHAGSMWLLTGIALLVIGVMVVGIVADTTQPVGLWCAIGTFLLCALITPVLAQPVLTATLATSPFHVSNVTAKHILKTLAVPLVCIGPPTGIVLMTVGRATNLLHVLGAVSVMVFAFFPLLIGFLFFTMQVMISTQPAPREE